MKKISFVVLLMFLAGSVKEANASRFVYSFGGEKFYIIEKKANDDGSHLAVIFKQFHFCYIPLWNWDKRFCFVSDAGLESGNYQDLSAYEEYLLNKGYKLKVGFWNAVGGKLIVALLLFWLFNEQLVFIFVALFCLFFPNRNRSPDENKNETSPKKIDGQTANKVKVKRNLIKVEWFFEEFKTYVIKVFKTYQVSSGRARRKEYWLWTIFAFCFNVLLFAFLCFLNSSFADKGSFILDILRLLCFLCFIAVFIPSVAVLVRRLHDTGHAGWSFFRCFTIIGFFVVFDWLCQDSDPDENEYGPNPKEVNKQTNEIKEKNKEQTTNKIEVEF